MAKSLSSSQQNYVLVAAILASSMAFIDGTALNVALPALQRALDLSGPQLLWVVNGYTLMLAALTLFGGALGDIYGKRRVFMWGIAGFTLFSMACGLAQDGFWLIVFRALQGLAAALMVPGSLSIITASFPSATRGRAIGSWSMFSTLTTVMGPVLGGYLAGAGLWRAVFFINLPLGLISLALLWWKVEEPVRPRNQGLDWRGSLLSTLAFCGITFGFIQASEQGFGDPLIALSLLGGAIFFAVFLWWEQRSAYPMLPLKLFRSPTFSGANAMTLFVYGALGTVLFFLPLNLIQIQGYREELAGAAILPFGLTIAILARVSGNWTDKVGARLPLIIGPLLTAGGFLALSLIGLTAGVSDFWHSFFPALLLTGVGMGLTVVPLTTAVMNCVEEDSAGIASGVNNTVSRLGGVLLLAIVGALVLIQFQAGVREELSHSTLSAGQQQYMASEASKLAEASAPQSWPEQQQQVVRSAVQKNFIAIFNLSSWIGAGLCIIGALISAIFIAGKPKTIKLE